MKSKKIVKLAEKKLKKSNKWLKKFGDFDIGHLDGTFDQVKNTKEICELILNVERLKNPKVSKKTMKSIKDSINNRGKTFKNTKSLIKELKG